MAGAEQDTSWRALVAEGRGPLVAIVALGVWLNAADALVTVTLMPSVARSLGGYAFFAWATAGFLLGGIVASASSGFFANRIGLRAGLLIAGGSYLVGCVMSAAAPTIWLFLVGRLMQGVGAGWIVGLSFVVIGVALPQSLAGRVFSSLAGIWGAATLLGPLVGGLFATFGLWRWAFWAFAMQAVLFIAGVAVLAPAKQAGDEAAERAPVVQLGLVALGVLAIALVGVRPTDEAIYWLAAGVALLVAVPWLDSRMRARLLPRVATDVRSPSAAGYAAVFMLSAGGTVHSVYTPILLQRIHAVTPLVSGYATTAEAMGWSLVALLVGGARRIPLMIRIGSTVALAGLVALTVTVGGASVMVVGLAAALMGAGFGFCFGFIAARITERVEGDGERALASSAVPTVQALGNASGAALAGAAAGLLGLGRPFDAALASRAALPLFGVFIPLMALGTIAAWRLASRPLHRPD